MPDRRTDPDLPVGGIGRHQELTGASGRGSGGESPRSLPLRTCIGCRRVTNQAELMRVVRRSDDTLAVGRALPGRGAWLCAGSVTCIDTAERRKAFGRALRGPVAASSIESLRVEVMRCAKMGGRSTGRTEEREPDVT